MRLRIAHASMQFSDSTAQQRTDVARLFERAQRLNYAWITGTESGGASDLRSLLAAEAKERGYRFEAGHGQDSWIAVKRDLIDGDWTEHYEKIVDGKAGQFSDKGVLAVGFRNDEIGPVHVIACHYLTRGRPNAKDPDYRERLPQNRALAKAIGDYAREVGKGKALVFYGGDQNIVDRTDDTFFGEPLTSAWDEIGRWENTGHGNIDVIATYDADKRVSAESARALDDTEFPMFTDHFLIEAVVEIAPLSAKETPVKDIKPPSPPVVGGIPANHSGENNHPPTRVVIHSAVAPCQPGMARRLGEMNRAGSTGGSWHYATDPAETIQCSYDRFVCWHAPPNGRSLGIEMADTPGKWQRGVVWRWAGKNHRAMLRRTARLTAHLALAYDLPLVWLSPSDLKAGKRGITSHANVSLAFRQSTHWDPGWWPRRRFMRMVRAEAKALRAG